MELPRFRIHMKHGVFPFDRFLKDYDVWEFHPMDQGGRLVQLQLVGSESDADMVAALRRPGFFSPWGDPIQWDRLEFTELEKSVWLSRWYYLPSFARLYSITGDRSYLDDLLRLFRRWSIDNPVPQDLPDYFRSRRYIWRDMQVAWRTQNLIWCFFLGRKGFDSAEQQEMLDSIAAHARVLDAYFGDQPLSVGNHQSHAALAMLQMAILFPELTTAFSWRDKALKILHHHLEEAFFADGNSVELCPGYYPFIAANFRNAYLLCDANNVSLSPRWRERLTQFHQFMRRVQQPDGTMPPINDSSETPAGPSLRILADVLGIHADPQPGGSTHFVDSQQAVMRDATGAHSAYVFLDAGVAWPYHWHGGKLGFHYWHDGRPYLVDSGVCNYDDPLRVAWYLKPEAHNTVLVDDLGDADAARQFSTDPTDVGCRLCGWQSTPEYDLATMSNAAFEALPTPVSWTRQFLFLKRRQLIVVVDRLDGATEHEYRWLFHFAPTTLRTYAFRKQVLTGFDDRNLLLAPFCPEKFARMEVRQGHVNRHSRNLSAPVTNFVARGACLEVAFLALPVSGREFPALRLQQMAAVDGLSLKIDLGGELVGLVIPHSSSEVIIETTKSDKVTPEATCV
jgi:hypothetical protein